MAAQCKLGGFFVIGPNESNVPITATYLLMRDTHVRTLHRTRFAALFALALCTNFMLVAGHDHQRLVEIAAVLLGAGLVLCASKTYLAELSPGVSGKALSLFFVLGLCGAVSGFSPRLAAFEVGNLFLLYLLATMLAAEIRRHGRQALDATLQYLAIGCALYVFLFIIAYVGGLSLGNQLAVDDFTTNFSNIRFFNHTQTSTLPLLILLCCLTPRTSKLRWLWLAVTTYWWLALYATSARGTLMGMAAGCAVVALVGRQRAVPYLRVIGLTVIAAAAAYYVLLVAVPPMFGIGGMNAFSDTLNRTAADPTSARTYLWQRALSLIVQHPWLGAGPMHFAHHAGDMHLGAHPHDWLMQIGAEWGLPALLCLIIAIGLGLRALVRTGLRVPANDTDNQTIFAALLVGAVEILVDGLVSGIFVMPQSQLGVALFLGCALGWQRHLTPAAPQNVPHRAVRLLMKAAVVAAMVAVIAAVWADVPARWRDDDLTPAQQAANTGMLSPRLWKAGYF